MIISSAKLSTEEATVDFLAHYTTSHDVILVNTFPVFSFGW